MKKLFFTLVAAMMAATATFAQTTLVATLTHGENVTMYYGTYALSDAHKAAVDGDIVNLSGGKFQSCSITKAIRLRGTGIDEKNPTYIKGDFGLNTASSETGGFSMEGIHCLGNVMINGATNNPLFSKCFFNGFSYLGNSPSMMGAIFTNCIVRTFYMYGWYSVQFINSYVSNYDNRSDWAANASFVNCIINSYPDNMKKTQIINSVIASPNNETNASLPSTSAVSNCIAINAPNAFYDSQSNDNCHYSTYTEVFKTFTGTFNDTETFELTDEAKTRFLGIDGTQIGLYGGLMPYTSIPSYPRITKMNVSSKTTADGKLSVDIEVSAAQ